MRRLRPPRALVVIVVVGTAIRPLYPPLLGAVQWVALHTPLPDGVGGLVAFVNVIAPVCSIALVFDIARRLIDNRTAVVPAALVAVWPNLMFHTATTLSETVAAATREAGWSSRQPSVWA